MGVELRNKTLGVIGMGRIGSQVVNRCKAFGMDAMAYDPYLPEEVAKQMGVELTDLEKVLKSTIEILMDKITIEREIKTLTSQKKFEGNIITAMPLIVIMSFATSVTSTFTPLSALAEKVSIVPNIQTAQSKAINLADFAFNVLFLCIKNSSLNHLLHYIFRFILLQNIGLCNRFFIFFVKITVFLF